MSDRYDQLEAELLNMRRRMHRLAATNVLLAVVVLAFGGAGAAYALAAANTVNSASIIDGSIVTPDLKVGAISGSRLLDHGITSSKIYPNTLTGAQINESTLAIPKIFTTAVASGGTTSFGAGTSSRTSAGTYSVNYGFAVGQCTAQVTPGFAAEGGTASALLTTTALPAFVSSNAVTVQSYNNNTPATAVDTAFFLTLVCP